MQDPIVSICCITFNQRKYLSQMLEGVSKQVVSFPTEIVIHDDASTDGSISVLQEYEREHPNVTLLLEEENQFSRGNLPLTLSWPSLRGKYIAFCEGDDFWIDSEKLQRQIDLLEQNPTCSACFHPAKIIEENGCDTNSLIGSIQNFGCEIIRGTDILRSIFNTRNPVAQLSGLMVRRSALDLDSMRQLESILGVEDMPLQMLVASQGDFIYLPQAMSCYRWMSQGSWSEKHQNTHHAEKWRENSCVCFEKFDKMTNSRWKSDICEAVLQIQYESCLANNDRKGMLLPKFKSIFIKEPLSTKILTVVGAYCPCGEKVCMWLRKRKRTS